MSTSPPSRGFHFGTKAETLQALLGSLHTCTVPPLVYFSVQQWQQDPAAQLSRVSQAFGGAVLAVRSSALIEDSGQFSHAGAFTSVLGVESAPEARQRAVTRVIASYSGNPRDQVLIQPMIQHVAVAGVITTRSLADGGPYFEINYDDLSGRTDTITGGVGANKAVVLYRGAPDHHINSARVLRWLHMARELEERCGPVPLDIEFAEQADGVLVLLQVRRIAAQHRWDARVAPMVDETLPHLVTVLRELSAPRAGVWGRRAIFGEMSDWNPAEVIGTSPRPLAASLYRLLVTDRVWREARAQMGYRHPPGTPLMVLLAGRPYIDVRAAFNSFLPAPLPEDLGAALVDAWQDRLAEIPELHDKVEFEVAQTALDFSLDANLDARYPGLFKQPQRVLWRQLLLELTSQAMDGSHQGTLSQALHAAGQLDALQRHRGPAEHSADGLGALDRLAALLGEAVDLGTRPFAVAARHAFIADGLLRSAVARGALGGQRLQAFRRSLQTVAGDLSRDVRAAVEGTVSREQFMARYGHLRPGTYDILSARYDQREDLFSGVDLPPYELPAPFELHPTERSALNALLQEAALPLDAAALLAYAARAVVAREWVKFIFTRNLSDALEAAATWAQRMDLSRQELSQIPVEVLLRLRMEPGLGRTRAALVELAQANEQVSQVNRGLRLNYILRDDRDLHVVPLHRAAPNFVTSQHIEARTVHLDTQTASTPDLFGSIVCIENADPGYDWIFLRGIAGLITRFGGANSHMAIRCAEFGLPAAIGCGELTFERCVRAGRVELNCAERRVRPVHSGVENHDAR